MHNVLVNQFIVSHREPPAELMLAFDAPGDPVHGNQEGRFFRGYYLQHCFLPLRVKGRRLHKRRSVLLAIRCEGV